MEAEYLRSLPKAELHLHLEGSVTPALLRELSQLYGTEYTALTEEELTEQLFQYEDFYAFLEKYKIACEHLREPADYVKVLEGLGEYFTRENIRYAEIIYTPSIPWKYERDGREVLQALLEKSLELQSTQGTQIRWILDCVRQWGPEWAQRTAELAREFRDRGVAGIGLGGDEKSLEMEHYQEIFSWARAHRLYIHVHAGEIGDAQQVWDALLVLGANRIGHGVQSARDSKLMDYLRQHAIGLDICLTSNLMTGAWKPISDNPFGVLFRRGVPVSLNTDDPGLFLTSLTEEFQKAVEFFELTQEEVHRIALQGVRLAFLSHDEKMVLMKQFQEEIHQLST